MSKYEQVCDMLRERRRIRDERRAEDPLGKWDGEFECLAVIQDTLLELGPTFEHDASECARLMRGCVGDHWERLDCLIIQKKPRQWPLQSSLDA